MAQTMILGLIVLIYMGYLGLGAAQGFPVGYIDWQGPYAHFGLQSAAAAPYSPYVLPALLLVWIAFAWYRKSMIGEA